MKTADSGSFLVSIPRGRENEKVVEEGINKRMETDCNDQMSVILHLQAWPKKKKKKIYLIVHDIDLQSFLTSNLKENSYCSTLLIFSYHNVSNLATIFSLSYISK